MPQNSINAALSFYTAGNNCEPRRMTAVLLLLLALAARSTARPVESDAENRLVAQVRSLIQSLVSLQLALFFLFNQRVTPRIFKKL